MYVYSYIHMYEHTYVHACVHTYVRTYIHTSYVHTHTHTHTHPLPQIHDTSAFALRLYHVCVSIYYTDTRHVGILAASLPRR